MYPRYRYTTKSTCKRLENTGYVGYMISLELFTVYMILIFNFTTCLQVYYSRQHPLFSTPTFPYTVHERRSHMTSPVQPVCTPATCESVYRGRNVHRHYPNTNTNTNSFTNFFTNSFTTSFTTSLTTSFTFLTTSFTFLKSPQHAILLT